MSRWLDGRGVSSPSVGAMWVEALRSTPYAVNSPCDVNSPSCELHRCEHAFDCGRLRHIDDSEAVTNRIDMVNSKVDQMQEKFDTTMNTVSLNLQALVEACGVGSTRV